MSDTASLLPINRDPAAEGERVLLSAPMTFVVDKVATACTVTLTASELSWARGDGRQRAHGRLPLVDVIGASQHSLDHSVLVVHALRAHEKTRRRLDYYMQCDRVSVCLQWVHALRCVLRGVRIEGPAPPLKRALLLVNPFGGRKLARDMVRKEVLPHLLVAGFDVEVRETTHMGHAREICCTLDLDGWDLVITASGDGLVNEVLNGFMAHANWRKAVQMPIGIIPAGSGNGVAHTIGANDGVLAAYVLIKGEARPLDIFSVMQGETRYYCLCLVEWAAISDVDFESEKFRWMGGFRFDFVGLKAVIAAERYRARIRYRPVEFERTVCGVGCRACLLPPAVEQIEGGAAATESAATSPKLTAFPLGEEVPEGWESIDGGFSFFLAANAVFQAKTMKGAPYAHLSDGCIDLILVREGGTRGDFLSLFLQLAEGKHVDSPTVTYVKCSAFQLDPEPKPGATMSVDGEFIPYAPIYAEVHRGLASLVTLPITV